MVAANNKKEEVKGGISPVVVAVAGAVIGAGVAIAGTVALKDEKNRDKIKKVFSDVKDQAAGYMDNIQKQAEDKKDEVVEKVADEKDKVKKMANAAKAN